MLKSEALVLLNQKIFQCNKCPELVAQRQSTNSKYVPGSGNPSAQILVIGEAPGAEEEKQGLPFVGKAGNLLTNILKAAGIERDQIFITNTVKCRPTANRDPLPCEAKNCRPFLDMQIKIINPKWIICFGRIASMYLLGKDENAKMAELRIAKHEYQGRKVICTYHPSYLLRTPSAKSLVWDDLQPIILDLQPK